MPSVFDFEEIDLTGMNVDTFNWGAEKLRGRFGNGRVASVLVGGAGGLHRWALSAGVLPDDSDYGNLIDGETRFEYYFNFFKTHTTGDREEFIIEWRGKKYHAAFVEPDIDFEVFTADLFAGGVEIEQRTVAGMVYNADGSLFYPSIDITGLVGWYPIRAGNANAPITDYSASGNDLAASSPRPTRTTNGSVNVARWDGSSSNPYIGLSPATLTHAFIVGCATDSSFAAQRGLFGGDSAHILRSASSGTLFTDFGYGSNFQYRKNGTDFADNNAQCSMSGVLAVLEAEFPSGAAPGVQMILGNSLAGTEMWKGDVAYLLIVNNTGLSAAQKTQIRQFLSAECGGTITVI